MTAFSATGSGNNSETYLFDAASLSQLPQLEQYYALLHEKKLHVRPLKLTDYDSGYVELISHTTLDKKLNQIEFVKRFHASKARRDIVIVVIEDTNTKKVIGTSALSLELKFIHHCSTRGRVEHVFVSDMYREEHLSEILVKIMVDLAKGPYKCYKLTVDCTDDSRESYAQCGFVYGSNMLEIDFSPVQPRLSSREDGDAYLFDEGYLTELSCWIEIGEALKERNLTARPLKLSDYENGYLELLSQLTVVGSITRDEFEKRFHQMRAKNQIECCYAVVIIEESTSKKVVGASTLFMNRAFMNHEFRRARLEDVAVLNTYRGKNVGCLVVRIIVELARGAFECDKLSLDCTDDLKKFYAKNGFAYGMNMLQIKF